MLIKILKAFIPAILIPIINKIRFGSPNILFSGDDALFKDEVKKVDVYGGYGCGKSTLTKLISGLLKPDKGEVW